MAWSLFSRRHSAIVYFSSVTMDGALCPVLIRIGSEATLYGGIRPH